MRVHKITGPVFFKETNSDECQEIYVLVLV